MDQECKHADGHLYLIERNRVPGIAGLSNSCSRATDIWNGARLRWIYEAQPCAAKDTSALTIGIAMPSAANANSLCRRWYERSWQYGARQARF